MPISPASDLAIYLDDREYGTVGTNIFTGPVRAESSYVPRQAIFIMAVSDGERPEGVFGDPHQLRNPTIQIRLRHAGFLAGEQRAQEVYDTIALANIDGYLHIGMNQSGPLYIGQDEQGAHEWSINVTCLYIGGASEYGQAEYGVATYGG